MIDRMDRVSKTLLRELGVILTTDINDPGIQNITLTKIDVSRDLRQAKVYCEVTGDEEKKASVLKKLKAAGSFIRMKLAERIEMKFTPKITFFIDDTNEQKEAIDELFEKIKHESDPDEEQINGKEIHE